MALMEAAVRYPEFARALPLFVSEVRRIFDPRALREHLTRIEREHAERAAIEMEGCEFFEDARENERWEARFDLMKDLLTAKQLGTS